MTISYVPAHEEDAAVIALLRQALPAQRRYHK